MILTLLINIAFAQTKDSPVVDKVLNFTSIDYCPFTCDPDKENGKEGMMSEVLRLSFESLGYQVNFDIMPYSRAVEEVKANHYHGIAVVIKSHAPDFIYPELATIKPGVALITAKESNFNYESIESLKTRRMLVVQDFKYDNAELDTYIAGNKDDKAKILSLTGNNTVERALHMLLLGRADVLVENQISAAYYVTKLGLRDKVKFFHTIPSNISDYTAFSPGLRESEYLSKQLTSTIRELYKTGKIKAILQKYGVVADITD